MVRGWIVAFLIGVITAEEHLPPHEVDFIVVGAGAAGSPIASRLSEDGKYQVALLEAGGEPAYVTQIPYMAVGPFKGEHDWDYLSVTQKNSHLGFNEKACSIPRGKGLGGSTLINAMVYTRCNKKDYDYWASLGNEGWDYESVLPFFKKLEDYQVPLIHEEDAKYHNQGGPVTVTQPRYRTEMTDAFHEAAVEIGIPATDYNAGKQFGVTRPVFTIRNGTRHSTYDAYLKDARNRPNLHIITHAFVTKINFNDNRRAVGVEYEKDGRKFTLKAKKEIIVSGGAINSPHLLLLSGIGPKETLEKYNIPVVADLPGVGQNFQDHASSAGLYFTIDDPTVGFKLNEVTPETMELWERQRQGPLTNPVRVEGLLFYSSKQNTDGEDYPDMELVTSQPPLPPFDVPPEVLFSAFVPKDFKNAFAIFPILLRPKSRGYLTLKSSNPHVHPLIDPNFFSEQEDIDRLVDGVKKALQFGDTAPFKKYGMKFHGNKFPGCEHLNEGQDEYWECMIRHFTIVFFHPSGTCKMGPASDPMAVVNPQLRVHGVTGLRVADTSITPRMVTGHTMVPTIMIGEKAAHMILEDYSKPHEEL